MGLFRLLASIGATAWAYGSDKAKRRDYDRQLNIHRGNLRYFVNRHCDLEFENRFFAHWAENGLGFSPNDDFITGVGKVLNYPDKDFMVPYSFMQRIPVFSVEPLCQLMIDYKAKYGEYIGAYIKTADTLAKWKKLDAYIQERHSDNLRHFLPHDKVYGSGFLERQELEMVMALCGKVPFYTAYEMCRMTMDNKYFEREPYSSWAHFVLDHPDIPQIITTDELETLFEEGRKQERKLSYLGCKNSNVACWAYFSAVKWAKTALAKYDISGVEDFEKYQYKKDDPARDYFSNLSHRIYAFEGCWQCLENVSDPLMRISIAFLALNIFYDEWGRGKWYETEYSHHTLFLNHKISSYLIRPSVDNIFSDKEYTGVPDRRRRAMLKSFDIAKVEINHFFIAITEHKLGEYKVTGGIKSVLRCLIDNHDECVRTFNKTAFSLFSWNNIYFNAIYGHPDDKPQDDYSGKLGSLL